MRWLRLSRSHGIGRCSSRFSTGGGRPYDHTSGGVFVGLRRRVVQLPLQAGDVVLAHDGRVAAMHFPPWSPGCFGDSSAWLGGDTDDRRPIRDCAALAAPS